METTFTGLQQQQKIDFDKMVTALTVVSRRKNKILEYWILFLVFCVGVGVYFYIKQLQTGLGITGMRDIVSWGLYISTFVLFIAISLIGSLTSAILKLLNQHWATPITRLGEIVAVGSLIGALLIIVVDMGRPERLWHIFVYGRLQSPIVWDIIVVNTYLIISLLLYYLPLIPDLHILHRRNLMGRGFKAKIIKFLTFGWQGTEEQNITLHKALHALMIIVIPVALSIHTVTAWLFANTLRPGWDSTNFGPYFVSGAFVAGAALMIILIYGARKVFLLHDYLRPLHFDRLGKLLVLLMLVYLYFNINEYLVPAYKMREHEKHLLDSLFTGEFAYLFWFSQFGGLILPTFLLIFKPLRKPLPLTIISFIVLVAAMIKRYLIVIPTLTHPFLPIQNYPEYYKHYSPTLPEVSITVGCMAVVLLVITILMKIFPVVPLYETAKEKGIPQSIINRTQP
ncbi:MAG: NrfD/PsrC family molybdoenzyme membrane anchor subunit [Bacteroidales bacterium]